MAQPRLATLLLLPILWAGTALPRAGAEAQVENFPELDLPGLASAVEGAFPAEAARAIPYMLEIRTRLTGAMSEEFRGIYRENLYRLGLAHMLAHEQTGAKDWLREGLAFWNEFLDNFLDDPRHRLALLNRADSRFALEDWEGAMQGYAHTLELYALQLDEQDLLDALNRYVLAAAQADRKEAVPTLVERFLDRAFPAEVRLFALNALLDEALEDDDLGALMQLVVSINRERLFRYDLGINLRLLAAGDVFEENERYFEANMLFSMVLPIETLLSAVEDRLIELEERRFTGQFLVAEQASLETSLDALREERAKLVDAPRYTASLRWRQARVLQLMGRKYESFFGFQRLIADYPQHEHIEQFRYAAFLQGLACGYRSEARALAEHYLDQPAYVLFEKPVAAQLARIYREAGEVDRLSALADNFVYRFPDDPIAAQMAHSLGHALFTAGRTEELLQVLPFWAEEFPDGIFLDAVAYWSGMAHLFGGQFEAALEAFDRLLAATPGSVYAREARFRRGVALFGGGDYEAAGEVFTSWLEEAVGHPLVPEAHVFLGDLAAMEAEVETALEHYAQVEPLGGAQALIDHATFEAARLLLANRRFDDHAALLEAYLERHAASPAAAEAVLLLAESDRDQGLIGSAFDRYRDGIERFGNRQAGDDVDQIIDAWWSLDTATRAAARETADFAQRLMTEPEFRRLMVHDRVAQIGYLRERPALPEDLGSLLAGRSSLREALLPETPAQAGGGNARPLRLRDYPELAALVERTAEAAAQLPAQTPEAFFTDWLAEARESGQRTLELRLLRVLHQRTPLEVSPAEVGPAEVALASPLTRVWLASVIARRDSFEARTILRGVLEDGLNETVVPAALFLLGQLEMQDAFFDQAAAAFGRLVDDYFMHEKALEAALLRAEALRLARRYEAAIEAYTAILNERSWRGEAWAEATYRIGKCFAEMEETGKAQGFFERTYLAYSGYPEWAGRAVLASGNLLSRLGDTASARETYQYFLELPAAQEASQTGEIRARLEAL